MNHVQTPVHIFPYNLKSKIKSKFDHIHCKCFCQSWIFFFDKHFNIYTGTYRWDSVAEVQIYETFGAKVVITNRKKDFNGRIWNQGKEMKERQLHKRNDLFILSTKKNDKKIITLISKICKHWLSYNFFICKLIHCDIIGIC